MNRRPADYSVWKFSGTPVYLSRAARLGSTSPSTAITFGPQIRSKTTSGHCGIRAQLSSMPLSVRFRTEFAMTSSDLCRMGILGEPDAELANLLGVIEEIQQRAGRPIRRGAAGAEIFAAAHERTPHPTGYIDFVAHGMGLVSHEAPRLTDHKGADEGYDATRPLEADMGCSPSRPR